MQNAVAQMSGSIEHRRAERFAFAGSEVFVYLEWSSSRDKDKPPQRFNLRLKDVSATGICGLTDAPLEAGDLAFIQFEETLMPAAHVAWFRRTLIAFDLVEPLPEAKIRRLVERHKKGELWSPAMRARSDLPSWWTDVGQHEQGRKGVFQAGK